MQHNIGSNDIITIKNYFSKNGKVSMKLHIENIIEKIEILDWHFSIGKRQRDSYNKMKKDLPEDYLFIELDFKQKILIGMSPRQINREFYNQQQRSVLGFGLYYRVDDNVKCINIDLISDVLEQSGYTVVSSFRLKINTL